MYNEITFPKLLIEYTTNNNPIIIKQHSFKEDLQGWLKKNTNNCSL
jgi:hypothetical protein